MLRYLASQAADRYQVPVADVRIGWKGAALAQILGDDPPPGVLDLRVDAHQRLLGTTVVPIQVWVGQQKWRTIFPLVQISVTEPVLVATRALRYGEAIGPDNSRSERRQLDSIYGEPILPGRNDARARARRDIPPGMVLVDSLFDLPLAVKGGSMVDVRLRAGDLTILTTGQALTGGQQGQRVLVANPQSGRQFAARVTAPGQVEVRVEDEP